MQRPRLSHYAMLIGLLLLLAATLLYPIWLTVRGGFATDVATGQGFTLRYIGLVFRDPVLRDGLLNALALAMVTTALCALIGIPLAMLSAKRSYACKGLWDAAILVPLILPPFVGAIGLKAILGRAGALNALLGTDWDILGTARFWGVAVALALHLYPILYLNTTASLANLDHALDEAAETLGSGPIRRFFTITLPLIRPGLFAGGAIVFIWSFTELGTPLVFDYYQITSVQIFNGVKEMDASSQPYALTVVMLVAAVLLYLTGKFALGAGGHAASMRAIRAAETKRLTGAKSLGANAAFAIVTLLALVPHAGVALVAFAEPNSWYDSVLPRSWTLSNIEQALGHPLAFSSIRNSLLLASVASLADIFLGVLIGYIIVRTRVRGRTLLDSLTMLPLAVPGLVMAFGYIALSLRWPFGPGDPLEGAIDIVGANPNPFPLLIVAYAVRRLPYVVRATVAGLQQVSSELEEAARTFGATPVGAVRKVVVPLILPNLIAGGLLAFSFAMLEVSDSLMLAQQERHYPITKAIYGFTLRLGDGVAIASGMGLWGMALLTATLVGVSILLGKKLGAVFRV
ncbi:MAG: ABC transporter permease [Phycisphaerales bacterium]